MTNINETESERKPEKKDAKKVRARTQFNFLLDNARCFALDDGSSRDIRLSLNYKLKIVSRGHLKIPNKNSLPESVYEYHYGLVGYLLIQGRKYEDSVDSGNLVYFNYSPNGEANGVIIYPGEKIFRLAPLWQNLGTLVDERFPFLCITGELTFSTETSLPANFTPQDITKEAINALKRNEELNKVSRAHRAFLEEYVK